MTLYRSLEKNWKKWKDEYESLTLENFKINTNSNMALLFFREQIIANIERTPDYVDWALNQNPALRYYFVKRAGFERKVRSFEFKKRADLANSKKTTLKLNSWVSDKAELTKHYVAYLKEYPQIFKENLKNHQEAELEPDYDKHIEHDVEVMNAIFWHLNMAIEYGHKKPHKTQQLFIKGAVGFGKTRLLDALERHFVSYRLPEHQLAFEYENDKYDVLLADDVQGFFRTRREYKQLKRSFKGESVEFNVKNRSMLHKKDNPLTIMTSRDTLDKEILKRYKKREYCRREPEDMQILVCQVEPKSRATLHFIVARCIDET